MANSLDGFYNLPHISKKWVIIYAIPACRPCCHPFQDIEFAQLATICCLLPATLMAIADNMA